MNWHEELEKLGIEHQYETLKVSMKIDGVETTYTPDFVLPAQGLVIEVKGSHPWEGKSMQKTRMLAKMGYSVLKCTGEGKFNFIGNDSSSCFILKCPACSRHFFSCSLDETCPFCSDDTVKIWCTMEVKEYQLGAPEKSLIDGSSIKKRLTGYITRFEILSGIYIKMCMKNCAVCLKCSVIPMI